MLVFVIVSVAENSYPESYFCPMIMKFMIYESYI